MLNGQRTQGIKLGLVDIKVRIKIFLLVALKSSCL